MKNSSYLKSGYLQAKIEKIKKGINEKEFILSRGYREYLQRIVRGTTGNHAYQVRFSEKIATDGKYVWVNPTHKSIEKLDITEKTICVLGQLAHELFHLIYTDFKTLSFVDKEVTIFRRRVLKDFFNIVEDSAVELLGTNYYTGFETAIVLLNENALENMPLLKDVKPNLAVFMQACAMYCILGINKRDELESNLQEIFEKAIPFMDKGRYGKTSKDRFETAEEIYKLALPLIEDAEKNNEETAVIDWVTSFYGKNIEISADPKRSQEQPSTVISRDFQKAEKKDKEKGNAEKNKEEMPSPKQESVEGDTNKSGGDDKDGENQNNDRLDDVKRDVERQLEKAKNEEALNRLEKKEREEKINAINEFAKNVKYADLHRGIITENKLITKNRTDSIEASYKEIFSPVKNLTKNFAKNLQNLLRYNENMKLSGLYDGKIDKNLYRLDKKVFYKRKEKSDEANLAILVLVDESGSMFPRRTKYAMVTCMMMYEVCWQLSIPMAIIGHEAVNCGDRVMHRHYIDFTSLNPDEKYNLLSIRGDGNTREGVSLKYAGEYLLRRPEEDKILIAISDGLPYHYAAPNISHYEEMTAQQDTAAVAKKLESQGLKVIGVAIGDGKSGIKKIYKNYVDIPDINLLPAKMLEIIKNNLFK